MNNDDHLAVDVTQSQEDLDFPDTRKHTTEGSNDKFLYATTSMQGWRDNNEDAYVAELALDEPTGSPSNAFFAVYDGHVGNSVALFAADRLHRTVRDLESYRRANYSQALKDAFVKTDEAIFHELIPPLAGRSLSDTSMIFTKGMMFGSCAVSALFTSDNRLFVANSGDSRAVLSSRGAAKPLSTDAKPTNPSELTRIRHAGGVVLRGRILGSLAVSRAFGDFAIKSINNGLARDPEDRIVTCVPDITEHTLSDDDEFLVLACDGIWDVLSSQQVIDAVRLLVSQGKPLPEVCEALCELCLAPDNARGPCGTDNMTIVIIALLNGRTAEDWYKHVADRVKQGDGYSTPEALPSPFSDERIAAFRAERARRESR